MGTFVCQTDPPWLPYPLHFHYHAPGISGLPAWASVDHLDCLQMKTHHIDNVSLESVSMYLKLTWHRDQPNLMYSFHNSALEAHCKKEKSMKCLFFLPPQVIFRGTWRRMNTLQTQLCKRTKTIFSVGQKKNVLKDAKPHSCQDIFSAHLCKPQKHTWPA